MIDTRIKLVQFVRLTGVIFGLLWSVLATADDYAKEWAPAVGSDMPAIDAPDQTGTPRSLADLSGDQGLLLFLNRSADW